MRPILLPIALVLALSAQPAPAQDPAPDEEIEGVLWQAQIYSNFTGWTEQELAERDP